MKKLPNFLLIQIVFVTILFVSIFSVQSCKKETETNTPQTDIIFFEQAFPDESGVTVTVDLDGEEIECLKINNMYIYQGDIVINTGKTKSADGAGLASTLSRWPDKTIYYAINSSFPNQDRITDAINHWQNNTSLIFKERVNEADYIEFMWDPSGCWSYLGMIGGRQELHIADWGTAGTVIHEIGHAVGLIHEHSKPNRDNAVTINWQNIITGNSNNFSIYSNTIYLQNFDFNSIMLYSSYGFSNNGQPTITKKDGSVFTAQRDYLSDDDIQIVEEMYSESVCGQSEFTYGGQTYKVVEIGDRCWMAENLNYETPNSWWYDNSSTIGAVYGRLYQWSDALIACPAGWHLPSDDEWKSLEMALGMSQSDADETSFRGTDQGGKMKFPGFTYWEAPNTGATNSSGFNVIPGGQITQGVNINSSDLGWRAKFWTSSEYSTGDVWSRWLWYNSEQVYRYHFDQSYGFSVRCIKD